MARLAKIIGIALAAAGCITPDGYYRPDGGGTGAGGAPAQGGSSGAAGAGGAATGSGGAVTGTGGSAIGTGGSATGGKGGTGALGGTTGTGGTVVAGTGGSVTTTGGAGASGCKAMIPLPYTEDFETYPVNMAPPKNWLFDTADADSTKGSFMVVSDGGSNVLQGTASSSTFVAEIGGDQCWTDYTFQVDIKFISGSSEEFGVWGRFSIDSSKDEGDYYTAYMDDSGAVQLRSRLSGSSTTLGSKSKSTNGGPVAGTVYTFVLDLHGGTLSVSVNGTPRVSMVTDATFTTGAIGLAVSDATVEFDNVKVTQ
ncbi:MAG TPA: family 16 glycoside hydrolase [Polyangia bacterium]|jgi:hypothetical protein